MAEQDPTDEAVKPERKQKLMLLVIPLALLSLSGGSYVAFSQYATVSRVVGRSGPGVQVEAEEKQEPLKYGFFHQFDGLTVNPASSGGARYLMMNIGLEAAKEATIEELKGREIVVRDTIIKLLSVRTVEELAQVETRTVLKEEMRDAINATLRKGQIDRVYFTQYVLQ